MLIGNVWPALIPMGSANMSLEYMCALWCLQQNTRMVVQNLKMLTFALDKLIPSEYQYIMDH